MWSGSQPIARRWPGPRASVLTRNRKPMGSGGSSFSGIGRGPFQGPALTRGTSLRSVMVARKALNADRVVRHPDGVLTASIRCC